ncbi:hypothetical protein BM221_001557 [Beauveria bassiana]|uniref:Uncharacterized protein n=1 Tax=Beauveria bassiana TaxID=176275 RepID=A0A2N6NW14_BEABA|nr:hypothetical protein BM221_001557 [Beauveria bassiana]
MPEEEEEVSAVVSQHDGSSGDEARDNASTDSAGGSKKRKRGRYQKTSTETEAALPVPSLETRRQEWEVRHLRFLAKAGMMATNARAECLVRE